MDASERFNRILKESFASTIRDVLGDTAGAALLYYFDFSSVSDPMSKLGLMRTVLGMGSSTIEKMMVFDLYRRLGLRYENGGESDFEEDVAKAKTRYLTNETGDKGQ